MKRKRKEHLAGISIRKFAGLKKSALIKRTLKNKSLKAAGRDPAVDAQELVERIDTPKTAGELRQMARETFGKQHGDRVQSELVHNFSKYGLVMRKGANNNVQIYGREEMFR